MILTPIADSELPNLLARFDGALSSESQRAVFRRIVDSGDPARATAQKSVKNHSESIDLITSFYIGLKPGAPRLDVSWDGAELRSETEAYILLHELAHYQLASPRRRFTVDFGLGPGPETGDRDRAERAALLFGAAREHEEAMASLLGILWEAELGHPALASFLDQNWLEGVVRIQTRRGAAIHFENILAQLARDGFVTADFRPARTLRHDEDGNPGLGPV
jgi:hypothetical protein